MESVQKYRSLEEIDRQIQQNLRSITQLKQESEWISEYTKTDKLGNTVSKTPKYNKNISYYEQFWKTYLINEMIILKAKELTTKNKQMGTVVGSIQQLLKERTRLLSERYQKKKRRTSSEINKAYKCPYPECSKRYGCDVSMNLHIKLKHLGGNKTEREQLARQICQAEMNGTQAPQITLIFPPGYLEQFKEEYKDRLKKAGHLPRRT